MRMQYGYGFGRDLSELLKQDITRGRILTVLLIQKRAVMTHGSLKIALIYEFYEAYKASVIQMWTATGLRSEKLPTT